MTISIIVAASANNVIGANGGLPWHLPEDLRRFKALTMGKPIIMGRLTFESIGRALPGRRNIVITTQSDYDAPGCDVVDNAANAVEVAGDVEEVMVIGGGQVYEQFLPETNRIYLTRVFADIEGDTFFPKLEPQNWQTVASEEFEGNDERQFGFSFETLQRRSN